MTHLKNIFLSLAALIVFTTVMAQPHKTGVPKVAPAQKFKPPKLITSLGNRSDSVAVGIEEGLQLIELPLQVFDDKKISYVISSYQFMYKKLGVTEDEQSGKVTPASSVVADLFRSTPLPRIWVKNISEQLKPGEEFYFFDVVARDMQGHLFFAPTLKIKIK